MATTANPRRVRVPYAHRPEALAGLTAKDLIGTVNPFGPAGANITQEATLWEAVIRLLTHHTRHLVVVDDQRHYRGLLSDRHLVATSPVDEKALQRRYVKEVTGLDRPMLMPGTRITTIAQLLTTHDVDALPVIGEHGTVVGVVTRAALVQALADHGPVGPSTNGFPVAR
ncbi:CBS domain-containing protein [Streptomyces sp. RB6PN25]|uniref:CBS domain-containing protein n=1 Tax=Streptomyces humicola TaxID=2953240 RepID=A0ABT1PZV5_9ACTN|nr:CBS domain-containing protein [Streptomyces humicola]MCQ4082057.1 CBS domain-containing protein [Streptomyces humicola]